MNKDHVSRRMAKMPWGKFKGIFIKDLPDWYIEWASVNYHQQGMRIWFTEELEYRNRYEKKKLEPKYV
jgi:uncharacterized protein (DUF3820 family)